MHEPLIVLQRTCQFCETRTLTPSHELCEDCGEAWTHSTYSAVLAALPAWLTALAIIVSSLT
jgi:hypothetical protein